MNYTLIIDKSGSMAFASAAMKDKTRYEEVREAVFGLAQWLAKNDPDGFDLYFFSSRFKRFENVTPEKVFELFDSNDPMGSTDLTSVLQDAFKHFNQRYSSPDFMNEMFVIVTDGEPDDKRSVAKAIVEQSKHLREDEHLTLLFLQAGNDAASTKYLRALDDDLKSAGAKFDIVDVKTFEDMQDRSIKEIILEAVID